MAGNIPNPCEDEYWTDAQLERALGQLRTVFQRLRTRDVVERVLLRLRFGTWTSGGLQ
jgi:hypothetical protein